MNPVVIFAICCLAAAQARPGFSHGGGSIRLEGVPNESHYGKLTYPRYDILDLGSSSEGSLPPTVITINKKVIIKEPQPYPVKVSVPVPHPVEVAKPYPVIQTKIIKVPQPVPVEIIKKVPYPVEVPKPFPVPSDEYKGSQFQGSSGSYGGSFEQLGHQQLSQGQEQGHEGGFGGGYDGGYGGGYEGSEQGGGYADGDQSGAYGTQVQAQQVGWVPVHMAQGGGEAQQVGEHQQ